MTLGEKLKEARKQVGLSQEELAKKMNVSRSAIAKWETDKGIPDVDNLRIISQLLDVSIDFLLDNGQDLDKAVIRESIDLSKYSGRKKVKKDKIVCEKYLDAQIYTLVGKLQLTKSEKVIDYAIGFLTNAPFGIPDFLNGVKNLDKEFYLINQKNKQFLVMVSDEFIESRELIQTIVEKKFKIGNWSFVNCGLIKYQDENN